MTAKYQIEIQQGADFERIITWIDGNSTPIDVTNYTAKLQIRNRIESENTLLELSTGNGGIIIGNIDGKITIKIDAATSSAFIWSEGIYALEITSPMNITARLIEGRVNVKKEIVR